MLHTSTGYFQGQDLWIHTCDEGRSNSGSSQQEWPVTTGDSTRLGIQPVPRLHPQSLLSHILAHLRSQVTQKLSQRKCQVLYSPAWEPQNSSEAMSAQPKVIQMLQKLLVEAQIPDWTALQKIKQLKDKYTELVYLRRVHRQEFILEMANGASFCWEATEISWRGDHTYTCHTYFQLALKTREKEGRRFCPRSFLEPLISILTICHQFLLLLFAGTHTL